MGNFRLDNEKLKEFCTEIFEKVGISEVEARTVSDNLIEAQLRGVQSHGIAKVVDYADYIEKGKFNAKPDIQILKESISTISIDGDHGMGAVLGKFAMEKCIEKAKISGIASATVSKGSHFGMAGFYSMMALEKNMIGIALCNSGNVMTIYGGTSRVLGTNPISIAVPANEKYPIVFDAATSEAAFNKIRLANTEGRDIPEGWAIDKNGKDTVNAREALEGAVIPFGGYKGSGLAVMVNILTCVLSGAFLDAHGEETKKGETSKSVGFYFSAIDIEKFQDVDIFKKSIDLMVGELKASNRNEDVENIFMPGEIEYLRKEENLRFGVEIGGGVLDGLKQLQKKYSLKNRIEDCIIRVKTPTYG